MKDGLLMELADRIPTPAYVFDRDEFHQKVQECLKQANGRFRLCFSVKANPFLTDSFYEPEKLFDSFEVCSPGELRICMANGISPGKIIYSGISKSLQEVEQAYDLGVGIFTAESRKQFQMINTVGEKHDQALPVLLRLSSDSQFGMDEEEIIELIADRDRYKGLSVFGIHYFSGTQKKSAAVIAKETRYLIRLHERIKQEIGFQIAKIEYGPGLNAAYFRNQDHTAASFCEVMPDFQALAQAAELTIEMGRFFAADCGYFFTKVTDCKKNGGTFYAITDGGMNQLHYDGQVKGMKTPYYLHIKSGEEQRTNAGKECLWTICGSICSNEDVICREAAFSDLREDDRIAFKNCGAYSFMEGMTTFLSREMPQIWSYSKANGPELLRDFIATDQFHIRKKECME